MATREERRYFALAKRELFPLIESSEVYLGLCPAKPDPKFCLELGAAIMLGKPLVFVVPDGAPLPEKLRLIADAVVVVDEPHSADAWTRIAAALKEVLK